MKIIIPANEFVGLHKILDSAAKITEYFRPDWALRLRQESSLMRVQELFCSLLVQGVDPQTALSITERFFLKGQAVFDFFGSGEDLVIEPIGAFQTSLMLIELAAKEEKQGTPPIVIKLRKIADLITERPSPEGLTQGQELEAEGICCQQ